MALGGGLKWAIGAGLRLFLGDGLDGLWRMQKRKQLRKSKAPTTGGGGDYSYGYCRFATERMMRMHRRIEDKEYEFADVCAGIRGERADGEAGH